VAGNPGLPPGVGLGLVAGWGASYESLAETTAHLPICLPRKQPGRFLGRGDVAFDVFADGADLSGDLPVVKRFCG